MAEDNPFADPISINPFADPAVTAATSTVTADDDYNPFSEDKKQTEPEPIRLPPPPTKAEIKAEKDKEKAAKEKERKEAKKNEKPKPKPRSEPAIMEADDPPPTYSPAPSKFKKAEDTQLKKREEEIARREKDLQDREKNIERLGTNETPKNFPPFPKFCPSPFKPCFYISVKTEIPPSEQWKVYALLALVVYLWVMLLVNMVLAIAGSIVAGSSNSQMLGQYLTTMGVSIAYLVIFAPGAFFCWFMPVYYAYKKDSSLAFMWFFFTMAFQILSFLLGAIGPLNLGACGWYGGALLFTNTNMSVRTAGQVAVAVMYILMGFLWLLGIVPSVILLILIHKYYRSSGGSINKAVTEGVSGAAKNQAVRGAMKSTVKAGVSTALAPNEN